MAELQKITIRYDHFKRLKLELVRLVDTVSLITNRPSGRIELRPKELKALIDACEQIRLVIDGMLGDISDEEKRDIGFRHP